MVRWRRLLRGQAWQGLGASVSKDDAEEPEEDRDVSCPRAWSQIRGEHEEDQHVQVCTSWEESRGRGDGAAGSIAAGMQGAAVQRLDGVRAGGYGSGRCARGRVGVGASGVKEVEGDGDGGEASNPKMIGALTENGAGGGGGGEGARGGGQQPRIGKAKLKRLKKLKRLVTLLFVPDSAAVLTARACLLLSEDMSCHPLALHGR